MLVLQCTLSTVPRIALDQCTKPWQSRLARGCYSYMFQPSRNPSTAANSVPVRRSALEGQYYMPARGGLAETLRSRGLTVLLRGRETSTARKPAQRRQRKAAPVIEQPSEVARACCEVSRPRFCGLIAIRALFMKPTLHN